MKARVRIPVLTILVTNLYPDLAQAGHVVPEMVSIRRDLSGISRFFLIFYPDTPEAYL